LLAKLHRIWLNRLHVCNDNFITNQNFIFSNFKLKYNVIVNKIVLSIFAITFLAAAIIYQDIYLILKLILYFAFWCSIIWLTKYLSRDFTDGRKNDFFGE